MYVQWLWGPIFNLIIIMKIEAWKSEAPLEAPPITPVFPCPGHGVAGRSAVWLLWPGGHEPPSAEALAGKWISEDPEKSHLTITFYRSGECELSGTLKQEAELAKASGFWELQGQTLIRVQLP